MIWAIKDNQRIIAEPKQKARCPICQKEVIAKCGEIKVWHFAHISNIDCDNWYEPESEWHIKWKNEFPPEQQEIKIGKHRADIITRTGTIIELQSSSISKEDVEEREKFYNNMIWLLNGETIAKNFDIGNFFKNSSSKLKYYYKWEPTIIKCACKNIFIEKYGFIYKIDDKEYGSAIIFTKEQFLQLYGDIYKKEEKNGTDNLL